MTSNEALKEVCGIIRLDSDEDFYVSIKEIAKKLNSAYYDIDGDESSHMYIVGSVGRKTAIKNSSDIDILFCLPKDVYTRFNAYESNGQSALLQEVKNTISERYPNTDLKGDGQVVAIAFEKYTIELVPAFARSDDSFLFPDSGDGGKWRVTNPLAEQRECKNTYSKSSYYYDLCRLTRKWKNNIGFEFKGLLIDTLVHDFLIDNTTNITNLAGAFVGVLEYYSKQNKDQSYWYALGSNQQITNDDNGRFVGKAKSAINKLSKCESDEDINDVFSELLGRGYPKQNSAAMKEKMQLRLKSYRDTEEFIEDYVPVDIRYDLKIDCEVEQRGFRPFLLSVFLEEGRKLLKIKKGLDFYISKTNCPEPYTIYWKVKNVGKKAIERDEIRGQILKTNEIKHHESTKFMGRHYVECYLIKNGICVARDRITVPIGEEE